jgi:hypothetical protein
MYAINYFNSLSVTFDMRSLERMKADALKLRHDISVQMSLIEYLL